MVQPQPSPGCRVETGKLSISEIVVQPQLADGRVRRADQLSISEIVVQPQRDFKTIIRPLSAPPRNHGEIPIVASLAIFRASSELTLTTPSLCKSKSAPEKVSLASSFKTTRSTTGR